MLTGTNSKLVVEKPIIGELKFFNDDESSTIISNPDLNSNLTKEGAKKLNNIKFIKTIHKETPEAIADFNARMYRVNNHERHHDAKTKLLSNYIKGASNKQQFKEQLKEKLENLTISDNHSSNSRDNHAQKVLIKRETQQHIEKS